MYPVLLSLTLYPRGARSERTLLLVIRSANACVITSVVYDALLRTCNQPFCLQELTRDADRKSRRRRRRRTAVTATNRFVYTYVFTPSEALPRRTDVLDLKERFDKLRTMLVTLTQVFVRTVRHHGARFLVLWR